MNRRISEELIALLKDIICYIQGLKMDDEDYIKRLEEKLSNLEHTLRFYDD